MGHIFLNSISIKNYKCFEDERIELGIPNGMAGSGLNILVGENGNGKTSVLEAVDYLTKSTFASENKLQINDFRDVTKDIVIVGETQPFRCKSTIDFYIASKWRFVSTGFEFRAQSRKTKARGKLLSAPFEIHNQFRASGGYVKEDGSPAKEIDSRDKSYANGSVEGDEINVFYFDKNRTRHLTTGNYRTTFEAICDDLNWKFLKGLDATITNELVQNVSGEYFSKVLAIAQKGAGSRVAKELAKFFGNKTFEKLRIDLLELLHPFTNAMFVIRDDSTLKQIKIKDLGSGIEMILTLLLLKSISEQSAGSIVYLIDEPELHLHPKAQESLAKILLEESKTKQIIVSTHSPYMFRSCISEATRMLIFRRNEKDEIAISDEKSVAKKLFPWSPSWGEINYKAYDLPTVEFHNELFGHAEQEFTSGLKALAKTKQWWNDKSKNSERVSLPLYIRNAIHHPENTKNPAYTDLELRESCDMLMSLLVT